MLIFAIILNIIGVILSLVWISLAIIHEQTGGCICAILALLFNIFLLEGNLKEKNNNTPTEEIKVFETTVPPTVDTLITINSAHVHDTTYRVVLTNPKQTVRS